VKIRLKRIDIQKRVTVEVLLNSGAMGLIMSSEFTRKQGFRLKKIKRLIEYTVKVNIYYQGHRESMEIDVISRQK